MVKIIQMGNLVLGGIFGPSWTAMAQVRKNVFLLVNGWVQLWMKRCGNDFNTPSCWSRLDNLACNDNNNTNIFEENDGSLDKIYFNSTCWYSPRLIYDDDSDNDSRYWQLEIIISLQGLLTVSANISTLVRGTQRALFAGSTIWRCSSWSL